jgi:hypothetical protein
MELAEILNIVLGGTSVVAIIGWFVYRKQNKRLKDNEVKASDVDTQKQQIELAELYKDKVLELIGQVSEKQDSGNANQQKILDKLDTIDERVDKQEARLSDIVTYLNGDFQEFLQRNHGKGEQDEQDSE